jgi:hypothetical protein
MNLVVICSGCGAVFRVLETDPMSSDCVQLVGPKSEWWPDRYTCPRCGAQAAGADENSLPRSVQTASVVDLTPIEMFSAMSGFGLPDELPSSVENIAETLKGSPVKRVVGQNVPNTGRCSVDFIELVNGVRVYFGASVHGAVVYRIVKPTSYAEKVLHQEEERGSHL